MSYLGASNSVQHRKQNLFLSRADAAGDPFWANVILFMDGNDFVDQSSFASVPAVGASLQISGSIPNGGVGTNAMRAPPGAAFPELRFAAAELWRSTQIFTLEHWFYLESSPAGEVWMGTPTGSKFWSGAAGTFNNQGWGPGSGSGFAQALGQWFWIVQACDGVNPAQWINGVVTTPGSIPIPEGAPPEFDVFNPLGSPPQGGRIMQIRWTKGVCRYNTTPNPLVADPIPIQSAPWPVGP